MAKGLPWVCHYISVRPHKALPRSAVLESARSAGLEVLKGRQNQTVRCAEQNRFLGGPLLVPLQGTPQ